MLFKPLALAASAAAFLVVPDVSKSDQEDAFKALPLPVEADTLEIPPSALGQSLDLACAQCKGHDTALRLAFAVDAGKALTLNGFELYPAADPWHGDLVAAVVQADGKERDQRLGYSLAVTPQGVDEELQMEVVAIELRVIEVGSRFVDGVPAVEIKLIKGASGDIVIGNLDVKEPSETQCDSMWCRTKDVWGELVKGFKGFKGCGRHKGHGASKHHGGHGTAKSAEGHRGHHGHHKHPHSMGHGRHSWGKLLKNVVSYIFLPVLMGVAAGIGVAMFAMFTCTVAVRMARLVRGRREERSWCARDGAAEANAPVDDQKSSLMEHQDPPPEYEEADAKN